MRVAALFLIVLLLAAGCAQKPSSQLVKIDESGSFPANISPPGNHTEIANGTNLGWEDAGKIESPESEDLDVGIPLEDLNATENGTAPSQAALDSRDLGDLENPDSSGIDVGIPLEDI